MISKEIASTALVAFFSVAAVFLFLINSTTGANPILTVTPIPDTFNYLPAVLRPEDTPTPTTPGTLVNGNFEAGPVGWFRYSTHGWPIIMDADRLVVPPHNGNWAAWLGGDYDEVSIISQVVAIPAGDPVLRHWLWVASQDVCGYDVGGVVVLEGGNETVVDAYWLCVPNNTGGWIHRTVDLSDFSGRTVEVALVASTDSVLNSNLFIDDVSLGGNQISRQEPTIIGSGRDATASKPEAVPADRATESSYPPVDNETMNLLLEQMRASAININERGD